MKYKFIPVLTTLMSVTMLTTTAHAMNINLKLDKSINNKFSLSVDLYNTTDPLNEENIAYSADGVDVANVDIFMSTINNIISSVTPGNSLDGKPSTISLSYTNQDGVTVAPSTCTSIKAQSVMNIVMNQSGCILS